MDIRIDINEPTWVRRTKLIMFSPLMLVVGILVLLAHFFLVVVDLVDLTITPRGMWQEIKLIWRGEQ